MRVISKYAQDSFLQECYLDKTEAATVSILKKKLLKIP